MVKAAMAMTVGYTGFIFSLWTQTNITDKAAHYEAMPLGWVKSNIPVMHEFSNKAQSFSVFLV